MSRLLSSLRSRTASTTTRRGLTTNNLAASTSRQPGLLLPRSNAFLPARPSSGFVASRAAGRRQFSDVTEEAISVCLQWDDWYGNAAAFDGQTKDEMIHERRMQPQLYWLRVNPVEDDLMYRNLPDRLHTILADFDENHQDWHDGGLAIQTGEVAEMIGGDEDWCDMVMFNGGHEWRGYVPAEFVDREHQPEDEDMDTFAMGRLPADAQDVGLNVFEDQKVKELLDYIDETMQLSGGAGFTVGGQDVDPEDYVGAALFHQSVGLKIGGAPCGGVNDGCQLLPYYDRLQSFGFRMIDTVSRVEGGDGELNWKQAVANAEIDDRLLVAYFHSNEDGAEQTIEELSVLGDEYRHVHVVEVDIGAAPAVAEEAGISDGMTPVLAVKKPEGGAPLEKPMTFDIDVDRLRDIIKTWEDENPE